MKQLLLSLILGVIGLVIAFPPIDFFPAALLALAVLGLAFRKARLSRSEWWLIYLAGVAYFTFGCVWLGEIHPVFPLFMAVFEGLALPLFCFLYRFMTLRERWVVPLWLALPLAWVAVEYFRSFFPLDGFPWLIVGYTFWHCTSLIQIADLVGVYGLSFLLAMGAGLLATWTIHLQEKTAARTLPLKATGIFVVLLIGILLYGVMRPRTLTLREGPVLAVVQANIPQALKNNENQADDIYRRYLTETQLIFAKQHGPRPSLVVWPETVFPYYISEEIPLASEGLMHPGIARSLAVEEQRIGQALMHNLLGSHGAWFLTGALSFKPGEGGEPLSRNGAFLYDPEGQRKSAYFKTLLVPGGEYLPYIQWLPFREKIESAIRRMAGFLPNLKPGYGPGLMRFDAGGETYRFGVQICFENIYGDYCRRFSRLGADFLINISNEGWFNESSEFDQMMAMSLFRAIETRRALVRSTNTGISCVVGPLGQEPEDKERIIKNGKDRAVQGVLVQSVPLCNAQTIYTEWGDLFAKIVLFVQIIVVGILAFKKYFR